MSTASAVERFKPAPETVLYGVVLLNVQAVLAVAYPVDGTLTLEGWLNVFYAFVWIDVGLWVLLRVDPPTSSTRRRLLAGGFAVAYFVVLAVAGGLLHLAGAATTQATGVGLAWLIPGWGPALTYRGPVVDATLFPYKTVGYVALAYLVYGTVLDASRSVVGGILGVVSCVSCTWPVLLTLVAGVFGGASGVAAAVSTRSYALSTLVFLASVGLLVWRPHR